MKNITSVFQFVCFRFFSFGASAGLWLPCTRGVEKGTRVFSSFSQPPSTTFQKAKTTTKIIIINNTINCNRSLGFSFFGVTSKKMFYFFRGQNFICFFSAYFFLNTYEDEEESHRVNYYLSLKSSSSLHFHFFRSSLFYRHRRVRRKKRNYLNESLNLRGNVILIIIMFLYNEHT